MSPLIAIVFSPVMRWQGAGMKCQWPRGKAMCGKPRVDIDPGTLIFLFLETSSSFIWGKLALVKKKNPQHFYPGIQRQILSSLAKRKIRSNINHTLTPFMLADHPPFHGEELWKCAASGRQKKWILVTFLSLAIYSALEKYCEKWQSLRMEQQQYSVFCISRQCPLRASSLGWYSLRSKWSLWEVEFNKNSLGHWEHCLVRG